MTETRIYVGETNGQAFDRFAGFRLGQSYQLTYTREGDEVQVQLPHGAGTLVLKAEQFEKWFRKG
jgi:hypothetical protein